MSCVLVFMKNYTLDFHLCCFFFSSRRRHTRCALVTGVQTCALPISAWQASVRLQVGPKDLPQAIALNTIAFNLARSVGPALGGMLVAIVGTAAAFGLNALSYVELIILLMRWHPAKLGRESGRERVCPSV